MLLTISWGPRWRDGKGYFARTIQIFQTPSKAKPVSFFLYNTLLAARKEQHLLLLPLVSRHKFVAYSSLLPCLRRLCTCEDDWKVLALFGNSGSILGTFDLWLPGVGKSWEEYLLIGVHYTGQDAFFCYSAASEGQGCFPGTLAWK